MSRFRLPAPVRLVSALLLTALLGAPAQAQYGATRSIFNTVETQAANVSMFPKWTGALSRYFNERNLADAPCTSSIFNRCHLKEWKAMLAGLNGKSAREKVEEVNGFLNRQRYLTDPRNYGVKDYWATPIQFLRRDGDCEDYAIAKFISLRALGFSNDMMRIVVLRDLNLRVGHAVLAVYLEGEALILDNQIRRVVRADTIRHYRPIYSINETSWWLHRRG